LHQHKESLKDLRSKRYRLAVFEQKAFDRINAEFSKFVKVPHLFFIYSVLRNFDKNKSRF